MSFENHSQTAAEPSAVEVLLLHVAEQQSNWSLLERLLDRAERERAAAFALAAAREEFVVSRGVLRLLLGRRTGTAARDIVFHYGAGGKPAIAQHTEEPLAFNVSHSHGVIAIALGNVPSLGIDVERVDMEAPVVDLARTAWGPSAAEAMAGFACPQERSRAFFRRWVRFEATAKYFGGGVLASRPPADEGQGGQGLVHREFTRSVAEYDYLGCVVTQEPTRVHACRWLSPQAVLALQVR